MMSRVFALSSIRISRDASDDHDEPRRPALASSVVANPRPVKPRTQALEEQKSDQKSMARNRRMFGMIVGASTVVLAAIDSLCIIARRVTA